MSVVLLTGKNTFAVGRALQARLTALAETYPDIVPERIGGEELTTEALNDLVRGSTLFSSDRIVILRDPSENKPVWESLELLVDDIPSDTHLIIVDPGVNKSTRLYKKLLAAKLAESFDIAGPASEQRLADWVRSEARAQGLELSIDSARLLIRRIGYDQWPLHYGILKLASLGDGSVDAIERVIEPSLSSNILELFEATLRGNKEGLKQRIEILRLTENPHMVVGLIASQTVTLALASLSSKPAAELAKLSATKGKSPSPYPYTKMRELRIPSKRVAFTVQAIAECDYDLKHVQADPWLLVERALFRIADTK